MPNKFGKSLNKEYLRIIKRANHKGKLITASPMHSKTARIHIIHNKVILFIYRMQSELKTKEIIDTRSQIISMTDELNKVLSIEQQEMLQNLLELENHVQSSSQSHKYYLLVKK